tara:strand:- start:1019 stop:1162 length:144 start_codon:yes stop_codon:yes gene_type:complete
MKILEKLLGIDKLIVEQQETNKLLEKIHYESKRNSDLVDKYNRAYHI